MAGFKVEQFANDEAKEPLKPLDRITPLPNLDNASSTDDSSILDTNIGVPHLELAHSIVCMSSLHFFSSSIVALEIGSLSFCGIFDFAPAIAASKNADPLTALVISG